MTRPAAQADDSCHPPGPAGFTETCPILGAPCPAAARLAQHVALAVRTARGVVGPGFAFEASTRIDGCRAGCAAAITTTADRVRLTCTSGATVERPLRAARQLN